MCNSRYKTVQNWCKAMDTISTQLLYAVWSRAVTEIHEAAQGTGSGVQTNGVPLHDKTSLWIPPPKKSCCDSNVWATPIIYICCTMVVRWRPRLSVCCHGKETKIYHSYPDTKEQSCYQGYMHLCPNLQLFIIMLLSWPQLCYHSHSKPLQQLSYNHLLILFFLQKLQSYHPTPTRNPHLQSISCYQYTKQDCFLCSISH